MPELNPQQFVDIYHGTNRANARTIRRFGLRPAEGRPDVTTVAEDPQTSEHYAHDAAEYFGGRPAVLHFRVPENEWYGKYQGHTEDWGYSRASGLRERLPGKYVTDVIRHDRPKDGYHYYS